MEAPLDSRTEQVLGLHRLLVEDTPLEVVRQEAVQRVASLLGGAGALWLLADDVVTLVAFSHPQAALEAEMSTLLDGHESGPHGFVRAVLAQGLPLVLTGAQVTSMLPMMDAPYQSFYGRHPVAGMALQPLRAAGTTIGLLGVSRADEPFGADDEMLLAHVGYVVAVVLQSLRAEEQHRTALAEAERHRAMQERLASTDELTSLLNRRGFRAALPPESTAAPAPVGVLLLDLDEFKAVNDSFGHAVGDALLMSCAGHLSAVVPEGGIAGRLGGDEFAVLLSGRDADDLRAQAAAVRDSCPVSMRVLGIEVPLRMSAGLAIVERGGPVDPTVLVQRADVALYRAKRHRLGLAVFDAALDTGALNRLPEAARVRAAMADGELVLHYQRLVGRSDVTERLEALVRWQRDDDLLAPGSFLPLVEEIGALPELTAVVLGLAVEQLVAWRQAGRDVRVAVNVPASVLAEPAFLDDVLRRLEAAGLPSDALELEVTEGELVDAVARDAVRRAVEHGVPVAIDDFGTGWSALSYLLDVPATTLKIDRSLVSGLHQDPVRRMLVSHIVEFAHEIGMEVVAEGVEERDEQAVLADLDVDLLQGFWLHRPCPADELVAPTD